MIVHRSWSLTSRARLTAGKPPYVSMTMCWRLLVLKFQVEVDRRDHLSQLRCQVQYRVSHGPLGYGM